MLALNHGELTLILNMLVKVPALYGMITISISTGNKFELANFIMDFCYKGICVLLSTIFTLIFSDGAVLSQMLVQILPHEVFDVAILILTGIPAWNHSIPARSEVIC